MNRLIPFFALLGLILWLLPSCEFDNDVAYLPTPIAAYFLVEDNQSSEQSVLKILPNDELLWQYETNFNTVAGAVSDLDLWIDELGVAIPAEQKILTFGLPNESLTHTYSLAPFTPHLLALGETRIATVDTSTQEILWINRKDESQIIDTLTGKVDRLYYMEPYFFLLEDSVRLKVWEEQSLSLVENTLMPHPVSEVSQWLLLNRILFISQFGGENLLYNWDFGPQVVISNGPKVYNKLEFSPYRRQETGQEWLVAIELRGNQLSGAGIVPVTDFAINFMNAQLYFHGQDSLWRTDLPTKERSFLSPFPYQIIQSRFYP